MFFNCPLRGAESVEVCHGYSDSQGYRADKASAESRADRQESGSGRRFPGRQH